MRTGRWILFLLITVTLFYWKLVFTKQFTVLGQWEPVTQSYSWYNFAASSIHKGILPIWDPFRFSGSTFIGEMQTGLFYPLKFLVYIMPLDANGMVSERIYNALYVLTHLLAAIFMFVLARHLRISRFGSFVAGLSFALGGYLANTGHFHTLDAGIWLPLIVLFFLRSTEDSFTLRCVFFASLSGLALGMTVLAGGIHMVIMSAIVIATMVPVISSERSDRARTFAMATIVAAVAFLFGAVQLLPSLEYGPLSYHWVGGNLPIGFRDKVPYQFLGGVARFSPRSLFTFLFGAADPGDHLPSNYFGVLPFFLSVVGGWRSWKEKWVKYFAVLAILSYLYSWGEFSFLHGVLYIVPGLDIAREAGRFILLTHFAAAILAGLGIDALFGEIGLKDDFVRTLVRALRWLVIFLTALLIAGSVQRTITIDDSFFMSFVLIAITYILFELFYRDYQSLPAKLAVVFVLLWDVYEFNWPVRNKGLLRAEKQDSMAQLLDAGKLAGFLRAQPPPFRVHLEGEAPPNIGDSYGIEMTGGMGATMLADYFPYLGHPNMARLLNVRYTIRRSDIEGANPVFSDGTWRVYENAEYGPRAWVVHHIEVNSSRERPPKRIDDPNFDAGRVAILERAPEESIDMDAVDHMSSVQTIRNEAGSMDFQVRTTGRGLLVASEVYYPGWQAWVNGQPVPIYRVDGFLRGVSVPDGTSVVRFEYHPLSVRIGFAMTLFALGGTAILGFFASRIPWGYNLTLMRRDWDRRAKENARHYVATLQEQWTDDEFFESGATWVRYHIESGLADICMGRPASEMRILEIGCGAGRMTLPLSKIFGEVNAVDISPEMIARAQEALRDRKNVHLQVNSGADLSLFPDEHFDFVFSAIVFQHIPSAAIIENYIKESWRVLRPGSVFKFQVQGLPIDESDLNTWVGVGFSPEQMSDIAQRCGFVVKKMEGEGTQEFWLTFLKL